MSALALAISRVSLEGEEWRPSPSLPEYVVSSLGRVMRVPYTAPLPNGGVRWYGGEPHFGTCSKSGTGRRHFLFRGQNYKVHRLVCEAFRGPAPADRPNALHRDEDCTNNREDNLFWGTQKENLNHPKFLAYCASRTGDNSPARKGLRRRESAL